MVERTAQASPRLRLLGRGRKPHWRRTDVAAAALFLLPGAVWFFTWAVYPLFHSFYMSFFRWEILRESEFVGLANYVRALNDPVIRIALENTLVYAGITVPGQILLGFAVAVLIDSRTRGKVFFRVLYYVPVVSSWVVVSLIFMYLFHSEGLINYILSDVLHLLPDHVPWLSRRWSALVVISVLGIWKGVGWAMLIFIAALQNIPRGVEEAARIDGASEWQLAWRVRFPLVRPAFLFELVMLTIGAFQSFIQFYIMTGGGPMNQTQVFLTYMYRQAFNFFDFGYAAAISFLLAALILIISLIQMRYVRQEFRY